MTAISEKKFSKTIKDVLESRLTAITELTDQFGVSRGTIQRWASGKSVPHVMARPLIMEWVKNLNKSHAS